MDIRQSPEYASFMCSIGWQVEKIGKWQAFIKKFPLIGSLIKIQRIETPIPFKEIEALSQKFRAFKTIIEFNQIDAKYKIQNTKYKVCHSPFLPTKTIQIDLLRPEKEIFDSFTPEKRRAVRKAEKNGIVVKIGKAHDFIYLKRMSLLQKCILPFGDKKDILALEKNFSPEQISFLLAYHPNTPKPPKNPNRPVAGILLLFHQKTAYYWLAASTHKGKRLFAPSLLVWEALKIAKAKGCELFDFEGIYDDRFPIESWKGFTKFKKGFGGKEIKFPSPISLKR